MYAFFYSGKNPDYIKIQKFIDKKNSLEPESIKLAQFPYHVAFSYLDEKFKNLENLFLDCCKENFIQKNKLLGFDFNLMIFGVEVDLLKTSFLEDFIDMLKLKHEKSIDFKYLIWNEFKNILKEIQKLHNIIKEADIEMDRVIQNFKESDDNRKEKNDTSEINQESNPINTLIFKLIEAIEQGINKYREYKLGKSNKEKPSIKISISNITIFSQDNKSQDLIPKRKQSVSLLENLIINIKEHSSLTPEKKHMILFGSIISNLESLNETREKGFKQLKEAVMPSKFKEILAEIVENHCNLLVSRDDADLQKYKDQCRFVFNQYINENSAKGMHFRS